MCTPVTSVIALIMCVCVCARARAHGQWIAKALAEGDELQAPAKQYTNPYRSVVRMTEDTDLIPIQSQSSTIYS